MVETRQPVYLLGFAVGCHHRYFTIEWEVYQRSHVICWRRDQSKINRDTCLDCRYRLGISGSQDDRAHGLCHYDPITKKTVWYYNEDNVPLGLGPIEPRVGEESTYNIRLVLTNNLHKVENVQVQAKLPNTVSWSDKENHERGDLFFKAATNEVVWNIFNLPKSLQPIEASFNVDIKPTDNDQGRILILLSNINLVAKDTETGALITKEVKALTTAFDDPILGQTKGLVQ